MFLFFPVRTDAPVYYFPWATISLIAVNVAVFIAMVATTDTIDWEAWALAYDGIHPLQWISSNFLHGGLFHVLGNMVFLWAFGLIVEGKLGSVRFLGLCALIGIGSCAIEQTAAVVFSIDGASLGFSAIVYGLMAISLLWAPKNDIGVAYVLFVFFIRAGVFEVSVAAFAGFFIILDIASVILFPSMTELTPVLHLLGAAIGGLVGLRMLKTGTVDCEGWDIFSVMKGDNIKLGSTISATRYNEIDSSMGPSRETRKRIERGKAKKKRGQPGRELKEVGPSDAAAPKTKTTLKSLLADRKWVGALNHIRQRRHLRPDYEVPPTLLLKLGNGLRNAGETESAIEIFEELVERPADPKSVERLPLERVRLVLAEHYLNAQSRPKAALDHLDQIDTAQLDDDARRIAASLRATCEAQIESGVIELRGRSW